jgi:hypothetical protein
MPLFLRQLVAEKLVFLTLLDVCSQKSSGHRSVNFGRNTYLHWVYNLKKSFNSEGVGLWPVLIWPTQTDLRTAKMYRPACSVLSVHWWRLAWSNGSNSVGYTWGRGGSHPSKHSGFEKMQWRWIKSKKQILVMVQKPRILWLVSDHLTIRPLIVLFG